MTLPDCIQIQAAMSLTTVIPALSVYLTLQLKSIIVGAMPVSQEMGRLVLQILLVVML
jgi:hypothetical protein